LFVQRSADNEPVTGSTFVVEDVDTGQGVRGVYALFEPDSPLDVGTRYDVRLVVSVDGEIESESRTATFEAIESAVGGPFDAVTVSLGRTTTTIFGACCYDFTDDSCGAPVVCVPLSTTTRALLTFRTGTGGNSADPRRLFRLDGGPLLATDGNKIFDRAADEFCVDVTALDVASGETREQRYCEPRDPGVAYGTRIADSSEIEFQRPYCLGPATTRDCSRQRQEDPGSCPGASDELTQAWCEDNAECREMPDDDTCRFYDFYCRSMEPPETAGDQNSGGCSAAQTGRVGLVGIVLLLALRTGRWRRRVGHR